MAKKCMVYSFVLLIGWLSLIQCHVPEQNQQIIIKRSPNTVPKDTALRTLDRIAKALQNIGATNIWISELDCSFTISYSSAFSVVVIQDLVLQPITKVALQLQNEHHPFFPQKNRPTQQNLTFRILQTDTRDTVLQHLNFVNEHVAFKIPTQKKTNRSPLYTDLQDRLWQFRWIRHAHDNRISPLLHPISYCYTTRVRAGPLAQTA